MKKTSMKRIGTICLLLAASVAGAGQTVQTLDAKTLEGEIISLTSDALVLKTKEGEKTVARANVLEMRFNKAANLMNTKEKTTKSVLVTAMGDLLLVSKLRLENEKLTAVDSKIGKISMSVADAKALFHASGSMTIGSILSLCEKSGYGPGTKDLLVVQRKDKVWQKIPGVLDTIIDGKITLHYGKDEEKSGTVDQNTVPGIWFAKLDSKRPKTIGTLTAKTGAKVCFTSLTMDEDEATLENPILGKLVIDRFDMASIRLVSDNYTELMDLTPSSVVQKDFFEGTKFPHRRDLSVGGGKLQMAGKTYSRGLGVHSHCELTYDLDGTYNTIVMQAGIDDSVPAVGQASLRILGDGKELSPAVLLTRKDGPKIIRVQIKGVKKLTIEVGYGPDGLDVADHVDIVEARLIK